MFQTKTLDGTLVEHPYDKFTPDAKTVQDVADCLSVETIKGTILESKLIYEDGETFLRFKPRGGTIFKLGINARKTDNVETLWHSTTGSNPVPITSFYFNKLKVKVRYIP